MSKPSGRSLLLLALLFALAVMSLTPPHMTVAQTADAQSKVQQLKAAMARNQQRLAQYTWQMEQTIAVNGDVKSSELFQEVMGPNGQPAKVPLTATPSPSGRRFGIRHRMTEDYEAYGKQIAALAQSYAQPSPGRLQQLYAQGNVSVKSGGGPGLVSIVATNFVKSGDSVTFTFNQTQKALLGVNIATYNSAPSDTVTMNVSFARLPDGTSHVASATINGQSKNMVITQTNMNYQKKS
ncbi:MAG: hypothetical protein JOZ28_08755 [Candidatus Eremiobacteraeota bacterium]|nr:hypothetical protein [Candidatus Eremiobacteraeota bacterium]